MLKVLAGGWCDGWPASGHEATGNLYHHRHNLIALNHEVSFRFCLQCLAKYIGDSAVGENNQKNAANLITADAVKD